MPAATERLFFALRPDAAAAVRMHELALQLSATHALRARPLAIERLHLTLCFLGNHAGLSSAQVAVATAAGNSLRQDPFVVAFDQVASLGHHQNAAPLVLCHAGHCAPLQQLHDNLGAHCAQSNLFHLDTRPFKPHVTLMYPGQLIHAQPVAPISWMADEVLLIRSHIGKARHEVLARHSLR